MKAHSHFTGKKPIAGKGQGLLAVRNIQAGTRLLSEKPPSTIHGGKHAKTKPVLKILQACSTEDQKSFVALHNSFQDTEKPLAGILKTNSFPLDPIHTPDDIGIFLQIARINHHCTPNSVWDWNARIGKMTVHAVRNISEGEEITVPYLNLMPYQKRRAELQTKFGFDCHCSHCSSSASNIEAMDRMIKSSMNLTTMLWLSMRRNQSTKYFRLSNWRQ